MVLPAEEEAFPRGGADLLSPLEKRQLNARAKADAARENAEEGGAARKRPKKADRDGPSVKKAAAAAAATTKQPRRPAATNKSASAAAIAADDEEAAFFQRERAAGKTARYVELLKFRHLSPGMRLWGAVLEVTPRRLVVSLPHGLRGSVRPEEASDALHELARLRLRQQQQQQQGAAGRKGPRGNQQAEAEAIARALPGGKAPDLTQLFSVGQYVRCAVLSVKGGGKKGGPGGAADDNDDNAPDEDGSAGPNSSSPGRKGKGPAGARKEIELSLRLNVALSGTPAAAILGAALKAAAAEEEEGENGAAAAAAFPSVVVPCCIKSVEDHGYTVKCGIKGVGGFLLARAPASSGDGGGAAAAPAAPALLPGALVDAVVMSAAAGPGRLVLSPLSAPGASSASGGALERPLPDAAADGLTLAALAPGTLVEARVRERLGDSGVVVSFLRYFHGTIDRDHLPAPRPDSVGSGGGKQKKQPDEKEEQEGGKSSGRKGGGSSGGNDGLLPAVGARLLARVLFVDPSSRRVGLSALPHVVQRALPAGPLPRLGEVIEAAVVRRVDPGLGLSLDLPAPGSGSGSSSTAAAAPIRAFCHVSNALDPAQVEDAEAKAGAKKQKRQGGDGDDEQQQRRALADEARRLKDEFKPGQARRARVIGYRLLDGLAVVSVRPSVVDAPVTSAAELHPAQLVTATVLRVEEGGGGNAACGGKKPRQPGVMVELAPGVRAFVPAAHLTDVGCDARDAAAAAKALKRAAKRGVPGSGGKPLEPGARVTGRVLSVDPATRRVALTLKPTLVKGRLPPLADLASASAALAAAAASADSASASAAAVKAHGTVTGVAPFGAYVQLYGGLSGLAPAAAMGLLPGQEPGDVLSVGQVVRVRVTGVEPLKRRLRLATAGGGSGSGGGGGGGAGAAADGADADAADGAKAEAAARAQAALGRWQAGDVVGTDTEVVIVGVELSSSAVPGAAGAGGAAAVVVSAVRARLEPGGVPARLPREHLSDHPAAAAALADALHAAVAAAETIAAATGGEPRYPRLPGGGAAAAGARALVLEVRPSGGGGGGGGSAANAANAPHLLLTRKRAMLSRASDLPADFAAVAEAAVLPGYVASVTADAAYVRFCGGVTGRAGLAQLADVFVASPARLFRAGQTVFARVVQVDAAKRRFALSLRPSLTGDHAAELLAALLADGDAAAAMQDEASAAAAGGGAAAAGAADPEPWSAELAPGSLVRATVHELKPYGVLCDLEAHADAVGVLLPGHEGAGGAAAAAAGGKKKKQQQATTTALVVGTPLTARVLDVDRAQGVVELSARPELLAAPEPAAADGKMKKKMTTRSKKEEQGEVQGVSAAAGLAAAMAAALPEGAAVEAATVLLSKAHYSVVSVPLPGHPGCAAVAFVPLADYNTLFGSSSEGAAAAAVAVAGASTPGNNNNNSNNSSSKQMRPGSVVQRAVVAALPSAANGGRLLLRLPAAGGAAAAGKRRRDEAAAGGAGDTANKAARLDGAAAAAPHGVITATVAEVLPTGLLVTYGAEPQRRAHVHVTELPDPAAFSFSASPPPPELAPGARVRCAVLPHLRVPAPHSSSSSVAAAAADAASAPQQHSRRHHGVELSLRPEALAAAEAGGRPAPAFDATAPGALARGAKVVGWVAAVTGGGSAAAAGASAVPPAVWLSLGPAARARLEAVQTAELGDEASEARLASGALAERFPLGARVEARVLALTRQQQPSGGGSGGGISYVLDVTLRAVDEEVEAEDDDENEDAAADHAPPAGSLVLGRVAAAPRGSGVLVVFGPRRGEAGVVAVTDLHDHWVPNALGVGEKEPGALAAGSYVRARVLPGARDARSRVPLSLRPSDGGRVIGAAAPSSRAPPSSSSPAAAAPAPALLPDDALAPNQPARGYVRAIGPKGAFVALDRARVAHVRLRDLGEGFVEDPAAAFPEGALVTGRLLRSPPAAAAPGNKGGGKKQQQPQQQQRLRMTLRPPRVAPADRLASGAGLPARTAADLEVGDVLRGFVRRVEKYGVFVAIGSAPPAAAATAAAGASTSPPSKGPLCGLAHASAIASGDLSPEDLARRFRPGQAVKARVTAVDADKGRVALSLRREDVGSGSEEDEEGGSGSEGDDDDGAGAGKQQQQRLSSRGKKRAAAGDLDDLMLAAAAESDDDEEEDEEENEDDEDGLVGFSSGSDDADDEDDDAERSSDAADDDADEDPVAAAVAAAARIAAAAQKKKSSKAADGGSDDADGGSDDDSDGEQDGSGDDDIEDGGGQQHRSAAKRAKKRARQEREVAIRAAEAQRAAQGPAGAQPQSPHDYERLLLSSPAASLLWVRYMAHLVAAGEPAAARRVGERAIEAIPFREQGEKFNVWMALLNLEAAYGAPTPEQAVAALFRRACPATDAKRLHLALLRVLDRPPPAVAPGAGGSVPPSAAARRELADGVAKAALKKFGGSCKVWLAAVERALEDQRRRGGGGGGGGGEEGEEVEGAAASASAPAATTGGDAVRRLLERATASLPKRKHAKLLARAALLEFRVGSAERGRSLFEAVLGSAPRRLDLWSVYADQELRQLQRDEKSVTAFQEAAAAAQRLAQKRGGGGGGKKGRRSAEEEEAEEQLRAARSAAQASRQRARALFERATAMPLPPRKLKFLFRRWLEFERAHGDAAGVKRVREAAVAFVTAAAAKAAAA